MVTKTAYLSKTGVTTTRTEIGKVTCPDGFTRRIIEVRAYYSANGYTYTKRNVEDLDEWGYNVWSQYDLPHFVDVMLGPRDKYIVDAAAAAGTFDVEYEVKFEETKG